ncbi:hypothetical protein IHV25_08305 [Phaeovibrio sulfidiphilus]|uniref:Uncharacterized protein n=1 Tax=Phaeovibrio sulfidiphilus TaxID=1220600 RepID=A0A8J6YMU2_9PROT|nr:hypothetical protein [Phaeovibrio sulfidiphilus]MBE1237648.1 hypothetical protein [Phaeovibrio sulfidiphilus]
MASGETEGKPHAPGARRFGLSALRRRGFLFPAVAVLVSALCLFVASCWLPNSFIAEIRLSTDRSYGFVYEGELTWVPLAQDIRAGKLSQAEIAEKVQVLIRDLNRDNHFKTIRSLGDGRFQVRYEAQGRLGERGIFIFLRRTDRLVVIETFEDGTARVYAKTLKQNQRQQIADSGITINGKFRVVTNGTATRGNAQSVKPRGFQNYMTYDWDITSENLDSPVLYVDLNRAAILPEK